MKVWTRQCYLTCSPIHLTNIVLTFVFMHTFKNICSSFGYVWNSLELWHETDFSFLQYGAELFKWHIERYSKSGDKANINFSLNIVVIIIHTFKMFFLKLLNLLVFILMHIRTFLEFTKIMDVGSRWSHLGKNWKKTFKIYKKNSLKVHSVRVSNTLC